MTDQPISATIPPPNVVRDSIGSLLRELQIARRLLRLSKLAEEQRLLLPPKTSTASTTVTPTAHTR